MPYHHVSSAITFPSNFSLQMLLEWTLDRTNTLTQAYTSLSDRSRQHPVFAATLDKTSNLKQHGVTGGRQIYAK